MHKIFIGGIAISRASSCTNLGTLTKLNKLIHFVCGTSFFDMVEYLSHMFPETLHPKYMGGPKQQEVDTTLHKIALFSHLNIVPNQPMFPSIRP